VDDCYQNKAIVQFRGQQVRVLMIALGINATMFVVEFTAGVIAHS
jgi:Co/Zn/Cd efflux system component